MRNVVLGLGITIDGYIARLNGAVDSLFMPNDYSMGPFFKTIDTAIMGLKTLDVALKIGGSFGRRERRGKNIWLMGGGELARNFLKADLVDELYLGVVPVLLGEGIPLFPSGFPQRDFALVENKTYSKGLISLKYARIRTKRRRKSDTVRTGEPFGATRSLMAQHARSARFDQALQPYPRRGWRQLHDSPRRNSRLHRTERRR